jgi:hypothetical protein
MCNLRIVAHCCALLRINYFKHLEVKILHLQFRCEREPRLVFARNVTKSRKRVCCVFAIRLSTSTPSYPLDSAVNTCWYLYEPAAEQYGSYRCIGRGRAIVTCLVPAVGPLYAFALRANHNAGHLSFS